MNSAAIYLAHRQDSREDALKDFVGRYLAMFNQNKARELAAFYSPDAVSVPPRSPELKGQEAILAYYILSFWRNRPRIEVYDWECRISGDTATVYETWRVSLVEGSGDRVSRTGRGLWFACWAEDEWKVQWIMGRFDDDGK